MRYFILTSFSVFLSTFFSCQQSVPLTESLQFISEIEQHFIPDRRVNRFDVSATLEQDVWLLKGETNLSTAKDSLLNLLESKGIKYKDNITVWPTKELGQKTYALTRHSVANLRSEKGHSQELATQVLLGTPLMVLKKEEEWFFVQCPDGYLAWCHGGELALKSADEMELWKASDRVIYVAEFGYSWSSENMDKQIGDLVKGDLLVRLNTEGKLTQIAYPDGRQAYVETIHLKSFEKYLHENSLNFSNSLAIANQQIGKPYLWGGTSPKAMDCSGFTKTLYWEQGYIIPRDASQQVKAGVQVEYDNELNGLQKGDLLFFGRFRDDGTEKIIHVGLYIGGGRFIHSGSDNGANKEQSLIPGELDFAAHRRETLMQARRLGEGTDNVLAVKNHNWYW